MLNTITKNQRNRLLHDQQLPGAGMLVAIAPDVTDYRMLAAGVLQGAKVLVLDPQEDAITQITLALATHATTSLHVLCHGTPGKLYLGNKTTLSLATIEQYRQQLLEWAVGDILLYGCNVATAADFILRLHQLTGAQIAASTHPVGHGSLGGSWHLEHQIGNVSAGLALMPEVMDRYPGVFSDDDDDDDELHKDTSDADKTIRFAFSQDSYEVNEDGTAVGLAVTIDRTEITTGRATVEVELTDDSATGGEDFDNTTQTIAFADSETSKTVVIPITDDSLVEGDENLTLTLLNPIEGGLIGAQSTATVKIVDNDVPDDDSGGNSLTEASTVLVSSIARSISNWVGSADPDDYYKFSLGVNHGFNLSLNGLSADANLELLDSNGNIIASSTNPGKEEESLSSVLGHGTYYVRVYSVNEANTLYDLNISFTPLLPGITTGGADAPIYTEAEPISLDVASDPVLSPDTAQSGSLIGMDAFRADPRFAGIDGSGYSIVIIDTGIDLDHPFFGPDNDNDGVADRIVYHFDFAESDADATDVDGHGSNVSSIAASEDGTHTGMAPGADIIHLKVFEDNGNGSFSYVEQALQWVLANANTYNIASVNISLSNGKNYSTPQQRNSLDDELAQLAEQNIIVASSSGNRFFNHNSTPGVTYPSADPNALSVGAVYDSNVGGRRGKNGDIAFSSEADRIAPFSQRHETLTTIFAPGSLITGANANGGIETLEGTSQAAPHIAGIAVLAQQLAEQELGRKLSPSEFSNLLKSTGVTINDGDDEDDNVQNTGLDFKRVDMLALADEIFVNHPPVVTSPALYRQGISWRDNPALRSTLKFTFAENTFTDRDIPRGDSLTYTATWLEGVHGNKLVTHNGVEHRVPNNWDAESPLPPTINFDPATRTFTIHPSLQGDIWIRVTATDKSGASANDYFHIYRRGDGIAIDNYIAGGTAFFDANKNGVLDENEPFAVTNELGEFNIDIDLASFDTNNNNFLDPEEGRIVIAGGTDVATGLPLATPIYATPNTFSVTMLTSVVAELVDRGLTPSEAETLTAEALSLPTNFPISDFDPVAATEDNVEGAAEFFAEMIKVQNTVTQIASLIDGASDATTGELSPAVLAAIASEIRSGGTLDLSDAQPLEAIIQDAATEAQAIDPTLDLNAILNVASEAAQIVAESNQRIDLAAENNTGRDITTEVARVQKVTMGETSSDLKEVTAGTLTIQEVVGDNTGDALDAKIAAALVYSAAPTDIELTNSEVAENLPVGTAVGSFSTIDTEAGETHTYSLVAGEGDSDNDSFEIIDNILQTQASFDYETKDEYSIRVQTADGNGGVYWEQFTIDVTDVDEATPVNEINGTRRRDVLTGTDGDDIITGFQGRDTLSGGDGNDQFVYSSILDAGDIITDFEVNKDKIVLTDVLNGLGYSGSDPIADSYISFASRGGDTTLLLDPDGTGGGRARPFIKLENIPVAPDPINFLVA